MLVFSRRESQTIVIGDNIELTVVSIEGGRVKLGITAPKDVPIRRSELETLFAKVTTIARPTDQLVGSVANESMFV